MKYLMGVDEGTTGCKAAIFDETGRLVSIASREYSSYYPHPGWVEQDIEEIKEAVFHPLGRLLSQLVVKVLTLKKLWP